MAPITMNGNKKNFKGKMKFISNDKKNIKNKPYKMSLL